MQNLGWASLAYTKTLMCAPIHQWPLEQQKGRVVRFPKGPSSPRCSVRKKVRHVVPKRGASLALALFSW